ncbi:MAG: hypothetical protein PQJ60_09165 [Spirochaetales bacterium]|nr:hypothetical protein [Spirochaetales bacterium]
MRIVTPQSGSLFYRDSTLPDDSQSLMVELEGSGPATLTLNGSVRFEGELPARVFIPLEKGLQELLLSGAEGKDDRVEFQVR